MKVTIPEHTINVTKLAVLVLTENNPPEDWFAQVQFVAPIDGPTSRKAVLKAIRARFEGTVKIADDIETYDEDSHMFPLLHPLPTVEQLKKFKIKIIVE